MGRAETRRWLASLAAAPLCLWALACSGGHDDTGFPLADAGNEASLLTDEARFIEALAQSTCDGALHCCAARGYANPAACVAKSRAYLHGLFDARLAAGARLDPDAARACLAAYDAFAAACPDEKDAELFAPCARALPGLSPPGGLCAYGCAPQAEGDVVCSYTVTLTTQAGPSTSPSICQIEVPSLAGDACDKDATLPTYRACDVTNGSWCFDGICSVPSMLDEPCHGSDCAANTYCKQGICQARVGVGGACSGEADECAPGTSCGPTTRTCDRPDRWKKLCNGEFN